MEGKTLVIVFIVSIPILLLINYSCCADVHAATYIGAEVTEALQLLPSSSDKKKNCITH